VNDGQSAETFPLTENDEIITFHGQGRYIPTVPLPYPMRPSPSLSGDNHRAPSRKNGAMENRDNLSLQLQAS